MPVRLLLEGDRRMEAESYLSAGYGLRLAIEARPKGWARFEHLANVWQPSRLKGIQVGPEFGTPFLAATQVFDFRPVPRKWLALERTEDASERFVEHGQILVTCSGSVGRATLAFGPHLKTFITHDLLRIAPREEKYRGWLYAYLRAPKTRAMMTSAKYGHIIKHLETSHLNALPIPELRNTLLESFNRRVVHVAKLRDESHAATLEAEAHFEHCIGPLKASDSGESGFVVRASKCIFSGRRRMEALPHNPTVQAIWAHLHKRGNGFSLIGESGYRAWLPTRFRRIPAADGMDLLDSSDIFEINPDIEKHIADGDFGDPHRGRVKPGWLLMARSGQIYGINGNLVLATQALEDKIISDHVVRIAPSEQPRMRAGYILIALTHPILGRRLVKSMAYGSSIPELEPEDIAGFPVVRLPERDENRIADLAEKSAELRGKADILENDLAAKAESILDRFMAGDNSEAAVDFTE